MVETGYRQLILMRHAKTEQHASSDLVRELTSRGRADARAAGRWLNHAGLEPDLVLTSPASRTRATAELVEAELTAAPEVRVVEALYSAGAEEVLEVVAGADPASRRVLVIGHNPTMEELARLLPKAPGQALDPHLPTAGIAVFTLEQEWHQVAGGSAELLHWHVARKEPT